MKTIKTYICEYCGMEFDNAFGCKKHEKCHEDKVHKIKYLDLVYDLDNKSLNKDVSIELYEKIQDSTNEYVKVKDIANRENGDCYWHPIIINQFDQIQIFIDYEYLQIHAKCYTKNMDDEYQNKTVIEMKDCIIKKLNEFIKKLTDSRKQLIDTKE